MDLIESMISLDFKNRISAKAALKHQFFQENPHACEPSEVLP
jgi:hypothetical protein